MYKELFYRNDTILLLHIKNMQWAFSAFRCENKGTNIAIEERLQWISKARDLFSAQSATIQRIK